MCSRDVAQSGRAPRSGRGGRWFKSSRPDHKHLVFSQSNKGVSVSVNALFSWWGRFAGKMLLAIIKTFRPQGHLIKVLPYEFV